MAQAGVRYLGFLRQDIPDPIALDADGALCFQIEVRSPRPEKIPPYVNAAAADLAEFGWRDPGGGLLERSEHLYTWLAERVLTFRIEHRTGKQQRFSAVQLEVYRFDPVRGDVWAYECLPVITAAMAEGPAEEALFQGKPLKGFVPPARSPDLPLMVVLDGEFRGPFSKVVSGSKGAGVRLEAVGGGRLPAAGDGLTVIPDHGCWFVERRCFADLVAALLKARPEALIEQVFLQRLQAACAAEDLYFPLDELLALHTALKVGTPVVLAGLSGTGKSRLFGAYRRALGITAETNFLWLPVRPSWDDDADLIGYFDPLNRLYRPGETGLVDLLRRAAAHPDQLYLVCFDEMNLARVEHYFAQFLSSLERPGEERVLRLYAPELLPEVSNSALYPPALPLGDNLLFCGTVNVDESAHGFSDKVLDRVNLIRLHRVDVRLWWEQACRLRPGRQQAAAAAAAAAAADVVAVGTAQWRRWCPPLDPRPYGPVVDFLQGLNTVLESAGPEHRFGYRVARQILLYLHRAPRDEADHPLVPAADALDRQVAQRILTKVRGASEDLLELFQPAGPLATLLQASSLSHFRLSLAEVARKHRELDRHDFTS